ncbi:MAG: DUF4340 domain-containing protein [Actinobacteria bacterium]|nr:DUF4340 domain-containing protein [Actinomycetota bacterium]
MNRWISTVFAVMLFSGLLIFTLVYDRPGDTEKKNESSAILSLDASEIKKITLAGPKASITLERDGSGPEGRGWRITTPGDYPADDSKAEDLASALAGLEALKTIEGGVVESLSSFGLERPAASAELSTADGSTRTILLGGKTPLEDGEQSYYAMEKGGAAVYTISSRVADLILLDNLSEWRRD